MNTANKFGSWVAGGNPTNGRIENDFYETPSVCIQALLDNVHFPRVIEDPGCGAGAISKVLLDNGIIPISTDLVYRGYGIGGRDYLQQTVRMATGMIANPPFKIAVPWIKKAFELQYDIFALLLKSQYWHAAIRFKLFHECKPSLIMPMTWRPDFTGGGNPTMDCMWCVWKRGVMTTTFEPLRKPVK